MGPHGAPWGPMGPLGAPWGPNPPRLGVSIFKKFPKIDILAVFGPNPPWLGVSIFKKIQKIDIFPFFEPRMVFFFIQNCGFGIQNGGPWGPLGPLGPNPSSVSTRGRCLRQTPPQKSDFWDFQARFRPGGAAFGKHLPRNPTFGTHTVSLCGNPPDGGPRGLLGPQPSEPMGSPWEPMGRPWGAHGPHGAQGTPNPPRRLQSIF